MKFLLENGADVNAKDKNGNNALHLGILLSYNTLKLKDKFCIITFI
jgi:ankyrin repeat protein